MPSTSSLFSGISCSPVRWRVSVLVANRILPRARTYRLCFADHSEANIGELAEKVMCFLSPFILNQCPNLHSSKACLGVRVRGLRPCAHGVSRTMRSYTHENSVANLLRIFCYLQAYLPLSYAARIPTTRNPDLANVRLSLSNLDQEV